MSEKEKKLEYLWIDTWESPGYRQTGWVCKIYYCISFFFQLYLQDEGTVDEKSQVKFKLYS